MWRMVRCHNIKSSVLERGKERLSVREGPQWWIDFGVWVGSLRFGTRRFIDVHERSGSGDPIFGHYQMMGHDLGGHVNILGFGPSRHVRPAFCADMTEVQPAARQPREQ